MIDSSQLTFAIVIMAIITFAMRYVFFMKVLQIRLNDTVKTVLSFTAPCILTAMLIPIMFQEVLVTKQLASVLSSAYFLAGICTVIFSLIIRNTLLVIILSMAVFYTLRALL